MIDLKVGELRQRFERMPHDIGADTTSGLHAIDRGRSLDRLEIEGMPVGDRRAENAAGIAEIVGDDNWRTRRNQIIEAIVDQLDGDHAGADRTGDGVAVVGAPDR